jgi:hypothetical protein
MSHLRPDEYVDAADETLAAERRAHLDDCVECRGQFGQFMAMLGTVRGVPGPAPSPLMWAFLSDRIRRAVADEAVPRPAYRWFQWPVLAPFGALALVVVALLTAVPRSEGELRQVQVAMNLDRLEADADLSDLEAPWDVMSALIEDVDFESGPGITIPPGSADQAVGQLTADEQQELVRLLRLELQETGG